MKKKLLYINIYCGFHRETIIKKKSVVKEVTFEIDCLECDGTGEWNYAEELIGKQKCVSCKGTGVQYIGL